MKQDGVKEEMNFIRDSKGIIMDKLISWCRNIEVGDNNRSHDQAIPYQAYTNKTTHYYNRTFRGLNIDTDLERMCQPEGIHQRFFLKKLVKRKPNNKLISCLAKKDNQRECTCSKFWPDNGYQSADSLSETSQSDTAMATTDDNEPWTDEEDNFVPSPVDDKLLAKLSPAFDPHAIVYIQKTELQKKNMEFDRNYAKNTRKVSSKCCCTMKRKSVHWKSEICRSSVYIQSFSFHYSRVRTSPLSLY